MKKKEIATALGLSVALTMTTGCASQTDIDTLNNQVAELTAQVSELETELSNAQSETANATDKSEELESQVVELQSQLESAESELEDAENLIKSADDDTAEMSINVTKYAQEETAVYTKAEENEENKIADLEMNTECYVVANFSGLDNEMWSAVGALKTTDENGDAIYQIITSAEKGEERIKNNNIDYFFRKMTSITVSDQTIKADDLGENQEIRIVYARTSLLSNSKVTEQQHTSAEKSSTPKQSTQQQGSSTDDRIPGADYSGWDALPDVGTSNVTDNLGGINLQFN